MIRRWDDLRVLLVLAALLAGLAPAPARAADALEPADVVYMNRLLYTMRAPVAGASPAQRAERAVQRLRAVSDHQLDQPVTTQGTSLDGEPAVAIRLGDTTLITVVPRDLDPEAGITLDAVAAASAQQLGAALEARRQMRQPQVLLRGAALSLLGLPVVLLGAWLARRLLARIDRRLRQVVAEEAASHRILGVDWSEFGFRAIAGTMRLLSWFGVAALAFVWVSHSLRQFPLTLPLAEGVRAALSVKIADYRGNEVTLPNSSVVAGSVINHSRLAEPGGVRAWVRVTIGYDVPWRQVSELLLQAAAVTPGVRSVPAPKVFQRALSDFAVEYEITVEVAGARLRAQAVSGLHEHIQDVFNAAGVAILSPHFVVSPTPVTAATSGASE